MLNSDSKSWNETKANGIIPWATLENKEDPMDSLFKGDFNDANEKPTEQSHEIVTTVSERTIPSEWMVQFEKNAQYLINAAKNNNLAAVAVTVAGLERMLCHIGGFSNQEIVNQAQEKNTSTCLDENFSSGNYL